MKKITLRAKRSHIFFMIINITNPNITYLYNSLVFILNKSLNQL